MFGIKFQANPEHPCKPLQQESMAHADIAHEARVMCGRLSGHLQNGSSEERSFMEAWKGREHEYMWERFSNALGWTQMSQAKDFYNKNKRALKWG